MAKAVAQKLIDPDYCERGAFEKRGLKKADTSSGTRTLPPIGLQKGKELGQDGWYF